MYLINLPTEEKNTDSMVGYLFNSNLYCSALKGFCGDGDDDKVLGNKKNLLWLSDVTEELKGTGL